MNAAGASLLDFLDEPVLVGDPEGRVIYANPAFEESFEFGPSARGMSFAQLFEGGGREAFLQAVAQVCETGETVRFRLREEGRGYIGVASPIEADTDRVGVIIALSDEPFSLQRLLGLQRDIDEPLAEAVGALEELRERIGGPGSRHVREAIEGALRSAERARKAAVDLRALLTAQNAPATKGQRVDATRAVRSVANRARGECARAGVELDLLAPRSLPPVEGDARHLETVLLRMVRDRVAQCDAGERIVLSLRAARVQGEECAVVALIAPSLPETGPGLRRVRDSIAALGGFRHACVQSASGRATVIPLPFAEEDDDARRASAR